MQWVKSSLSTLAHKDPMLIYSLLILGFLTLSILMIFCMYAIYRHLNSKRIQKECIQLLVDSIGDLRNIKEFLVNSIIPLKLNKYMLKILTIVLEIEEKRVLRGGEKYLTLYKNLFPIETGGTLNRLLLKYEEELTNCLFSAVHDDSFVMSSFQRNEPFKEIHGYILPVMDAFEKLFPAEFWVPLAYIDCLSLYYSTFKLLFIDFGKKLQNIKEPYQAISVLYALLDRLAIQDNLDNMDYVMLGALSLPKSNEIYNDLLNFLLYEENISTHIRAKAVGVFRAAYGDYIQMEPKKLRNNIYMNLNYLERFDLD